MKKIESFAIVILKIAFGLSQEQHLNYKMPDDNQDSIFLFGEKKEIPQ